MSNASEMKALAETLGSYPLMNVGELAGFLRCSDDHARGLLEDGAIQSIDIGRGRKRELRVDPLDAAVYALALKEHVTPEEFWQTHGPVGTPERCRAMVARIRKLQAAA